MGMARRNWMQGVSQRRAARIRANETKGVPIPGTGVSHFHKHSSGSNKSGALNKLNGEWSPEGRKEEDDLRGINNTARRQNIEEQVAEIFEEEFALPIRDQFVDYIIEDGDLIGVRSGILINGVPIFDQDYDYNGPGDE